MRKAFMNGIILLLLLAGFSPAAPVRDRFFDSFGDVGCESEMAHLDNLAVTMQNDRDATAYIFVYAGKVSRRGEAMARLTRIKNYLTERRGVDAGRIKIADGGYREELRVDLFLIPNGATPPAAMPSVSPKAVKFRKGKIRKWEYECL